MRLTRTEFSLDEVIESLQRESDAAIRTARAALGATEGTRKLDIPRRFPDPVPDRAPDGGPDAQQRRAPVATRRGQGV